jgi:hypothetical protein
VANWCCVYQGRVERRAGAKTEERFGEVEELNPAGRGVGRSGEEELTGLIEASELTLFEIKEVGGVVLEESPRVRLAAWSQRVWEASRDSKLRRWLWSSAIEKVPLCDVREVTRELYSDKEGKREILITDFTTNRSQLKSNGLKPIEILRAGLASFFSRFEVEASIQASERWIERSRSSAAYVRDQRRSHNQSSEEECQGQD